MLFSLYVYSKCCAEHASSAALQKLMAYRHEVERVVTRASEVLSPQLQRIVAAGEGDAAAQQCVERLAQSVGFVPI